MVVVVAEELRYKMEVQDDHIVEEVLVPMRNWCDSPNYGCKYYHMVNSSIGLCSPSWTYIHLGSSPQVVATGMEGPYSPSLSCKLKGYPPNCIALHMGIPFSLNQFSHRT